MPKMLLIVPSGRKMIVTMVNAYTAFSWLSLVISMFVAFCHIWSAKSLDQHRGRQQDSHVVLNPASFE